MGSEEQMHPPLAEASMDLAIPGAVRSLPRDAVPCPQPCAQGPQTGTRIWGTVWYLLTASPGR